MPFVTIERLAERSGVAKTTIYRHWDSRSTIVFDALRNLIPHGQTPLPEGKLRDRLIALVNALTEGLRDAPWAPLLPGIIESAERDSEVDALLQDLLADTLGQMRAVLLDACTAGEIRRDLDVDIAVSSLAGPLFYRRLVSREVIDPRCSEQLVDQFLRGARA
ncbi:MAG: TetR/AcrR family transcriptional regulator C-terminal ligand-binding domain-containing protein [Dehalococcoidia bacterium]|nr:TetR/AcrR family transcriptional regulator C-terminal ligand-binding domain-containing protein [Dehalococcoidia bacterium]